MECFATDFLHFCSIVVKIWLERNRLSTFQSILRILENFLKFPKFILSIILKYTYFWDVDSRVKPISIIFFVHHFLLSLMILNYTAQKMKFSIEDYFSKCDKIHSYLRIWSYLLKKSLMENFIFCAVLWGLVEPEIIVKRLLLFNKVFDQCQSHFSFQNLYDNTRVFNIFLISRIFV